MSISRYTGNNGNNYHETRHKEILGNKDLYLAWGQYAWFKYLNMELRHADVLEIGAGTGVNLSHVINLANSVSIVEPAEIGRELCKSLGVKKVYSTIEEINDEKYDFILLRHVLEHVDSPKDMLTKIKSILKPNGQAIIIIPVEHPFKHYTENDIDHHLYCWNKQTLSNLLIDSGYRIIQLKLNFYNGRRKMLPIYNIFGIKVYSLSLWLLGLIKLKPEIIATAGSSHND